MHLCHPTAKFIIRNYRKTLSYKTETKELPECKAEKHKEII